MRFHRSAFVSLLAQHLALNGVTESQWAKANKLSPGSLHDITRVDPDTGKPRRQPSAVMMHKLAKGLGVPVGAIAVMPESVAS